MTITACCFHKTEASGRCKIVESEGDSLILELFDQGRPNADREAGTLSIQRLGSFTRYNP